MAAPKTEIDVDAQCLRAEHAIELGKYDLAIELLRDVLRVAPNSTDALRNLSWAKYCQGDFQEGLRLIEETLALDPRDPTAYASYALQLVALKRRNEAETAYKNALALMPDYAFAMYHYAIFLQADRSRLQESLNFANRLIAIDPDDGSYHLLKGEILAELGLKKDAEPEYQEALKLDPADWRTHNNYGVFLLNDRGQAKEAFGHFREAIRLAPFDSQVKRNLLLTLQIKDITIAPARDFILVVRNIFMVLLFLKVCVSIGVGFTALFDMVSKAIPALEDFLSAISVLGCIGFVVILFNLDTIRDEFLFYMMERQWLRKSSKPESDSPPGFWEKISTPFIDMAWGIKDFCMLPAHLYDLARSKWIDLKYSDRSALFQSPFIQECRTRLKKVGIWGAGALYLLIFFPIVFSIFDFVYQPNPRALIWVLPTIGILFALSSYGLYWLWKCCFHKK